MPEATFLNLSLNKNRTLLHLIPGVNVINVKRAHFLYKRLFSSYGLALNKLSYEKFTRLTLMKLTAGVFFKKCQICSKTWPSNLIYPIIPLTCHFIRSFSLAREIYFFSPHWHSHFHPIIFMLISPHTHPSFSLINSFTLCRRQSYKTIQSFVPWLDITALFYIENIMMAFNLNQSNTKI